MGFVFLRLTIVFCLFLSVWGVGSLRERHELPVRVWGRKGKNKVEYVIIIIIIKGVLCSLFFGEKKKM